MLHSYKEELRLSNLVYLDAMRLIRQMEPSREREMVKEILNNSLELILRLGLRVEADATSETESEKSA